MNLQEGVSIAVELETKDPPFRYHGTFMGQDDESIWIRGTVGDDIGHGIHVLKSRIKAVIE